MTLNLSFSEAAFRFKQSLKIIRYYCRKLILWALYNTV